jgi:hypothetical protein
MSDLEKLKGQTEAPSLQPSPSSTRSSFSLNSCGTIAPWQDGSGARLARGASRTRGRLLLGLEGRRGKGEKGLACRMDEGGVAGELIQPMRSDKSGEADRAGEE